MGHPVLGLFATSEASVTQSSDYEPTVIINNNTIQMN